MGNQQERFDYRLAWLAALIEGEGWISLVLVKNYQNNGKFTPGYLPTIGVVNCDFKIMDEVEDLFNLLGLSFRKSHRKNGKGSDGIMRKEKIEISVCSRQSLRALINSILPFMIGEKKNRALLLLDYFNIRDSKPRSGKNSKYGKEEFDIYEKMYSYKGRRGRRSKILNDYTLEFETSNKI